jgi:2-polyprenyl-3-methyl-5-hydroxy-6-metoxy-1,4-benzoquinol methylase
VSKELRTFGVTDHDAYWRGRVAAGRTNEKRIHRYLLSEMEKEVAAGSNILDCGVGDGHVFRLAMEKFKPYGIELSGEVIGRYEFPMNNIRQADLNEGIPDFGVKFEAIVASMVLHWLDDPQKFLEDSKKHLTAQGKIFIVIPNITNYRYRIGFLFGIFPPISPSHKNFMTPKECEDIFKRAGYIIQKRSSPKKSLKARLWPTVFGTDILYQVQPENADSSRNL